MKLASKSTAALAALLLVLITGVAFLAGTGPSDLDSPGTDPEVADIRGDAQPVETSADAVAPSGKGDRTALAESPTEDTPTEAATAAQDQDISVLTARVLDTDGLPLQGAVLRSIYTSGKPRGKGNFASSDPLGMVTLELPDKALRAWETEVFPMVFSVSHDGLATQFVTATPVWHGNSDLGDIELPIGASVRGTVVDESGAGIPGALIYSGEAVVAGDLEAQRVSGPAEEKPRSRADADAEGRFHCQGIAAGESRLWVHARGFLWTLTEPIEVGAGNTLDVGAVILERIPPENTIAGVVVDPGGAPVGGATVHFESGNGEGSILALPDGTFTLYPRGRFSTKLTAATPSGPHGTSAIVRAMPGERPELRLSLRRSMRVTVVDEQGQPIEGTSLMTMASRPDQPNRYPSGYDVIPGSDWTQTNPEGQVTLLAHGAPFAVSASKDGYEFQRSGPFAPSEAPAQLTITLIREPVLSGRVTHLGQPVSGAQIQFTWRIPDFVPLEQGFPMRLFKSGRPHHRTDAEGRFECPSSGGHSAITLLAVAEGLATSELELDLAPGESVDGLEIRMTEGGSIAGMLLAPPGEDPRQLVVAASRGDGVVRWTRPGPDGSFRLEHLTPGPWRIEGRDREPARLTAAAANSDEEEDFKWNVEIQEGTTSPFDVDMRQLGDVEIHGRFTIDGQPRENFVVTVRTPIHATVEKDAPAAKTLGDGTFLLVARSGQYTLEIEGELSNGVKLKVLRDVMLKGQRLDVSVNLETGWVEETVEIKASDVRLVRGKYRSGEREITTIPLPKDGAFRARVPVGKSSLQTPAKGAPFAGWRYLRMVEVTP